MDDTTEPMVDKAGPPKKSTRLATWFSIIFALGFGVALLGMTFVQWNNKCDKPMQLFMAVQGVAGAVSAVFFLACEIMYLESKDPYDDGTLRGTSLKIFGVLVLYYLGTGIFGSTLYFEPENCEDIAHVVYRWTWATTLLFMIMTWLMFSDVFGKLGAPFFAKVGHVLGSVFQVLADVFNTMADILEEDSDDPENVVPSRSAAGKFAIYVNHAGFLWFFLYILFEAYKERDLPCDKPLRTYLYVFSITGSTLTYLHFLWEMFAGMKTREKMDAQKFKFLFIFAIGFFIWSFFGFDWVETSETCKEDGNAVQTFRISWFLSRIVAAILLMLALFLCLGILDFLCSGKMRFVVVISTGNDDDDEDDFQS
jgi:uncharacterized protein with PQ loop repeat